MKPVKIEISYLKDCQRCKRVYIMVSLKRTKTQMKSRQFAKKNCKISKTIRWMYPYTTKYKITERKKKTLQL